MNHQWKVSDRTEPDLIRQLLKNRGITDAETFFDPEYKRNSHDPFLLPGMQLALDRIASAVNKQEHIAIYADYDADGIPGGALLVKVLRLHTEHVQIYIPDREKEGYGLNNPALDELKRQQVSLVITVDLGVTNRAAVSYAASLGIDVIVTDHHAFDPERIPTDAVAVVHPAIPGSMYPFPGLAGGGVAWKLAQALSITTGKPTPAQLKWWVELPAISTVCDMVPLTDENRMLVYFGLRVLKKTHSLGLQALIEVSRLDPKLITERSIGFQLGPRINAPGRVDHANPSLELLLTEDSVEAKRLAESIEGQNQERRTILERIVAEAVAQVEALPVLPPAIILQGARWNIGLVGLAASRIVERYHRPTILLGESVDGMLKGSARSISAFHILDAITGQRKRLKSFGGHAQAAGLSLLVNEFVAFQTAILADASQQLSPQDLQPTLKVDAVLSLTELTAKLIDELERFAPFGVGNPRPVFIVEPLTIAEIRFMGAEGQHVKLTFKESSCEAISFRTNGKFKDCKVGDQIAILGSLEWNEWQGKRRIQLMIRDWSDFPRESSVER